MSLSRNVLAAALVALLPVLLAACTPAGDRSTAPAPEATPAAAEAPPPVADPAATETPVATCNAEAVQALVGQQASEAALEQARIDSGSASVRALRPGQPATMDYRPDRLDIALDADGVIQSLRCG